MINIAELLKDVPKGWKLYSPIFGEVNFVGVDKQSAYPINVTDCKGNGKSFTEFGVYFAEHPDAECLLFPSKDCRTWEGWETTVEPNFKPGDFVTNGFCIIRISSIDDDMYYYCDIDYEEDEGCSVSFIDQVYHLWTIEDAKDGDIIGFNDCTHNDGSYTDWVGIYKQRTALANQYLFHCVIPSCRTFRFDGMWRVFTAYPATKEQRDLLFAKMKEAGYEWDADKKELKKIQPHYDIINFKPFDKVLVRDGNSLKWTADLFSYIDDGFVCTGGIACRQCIPFNDDTKHLLGTTDMCDEQYINW